jgi:glc operon protein GlcG
MRACAIACIFAIALPMAAANGASHEGNGQVPSEFVLSGKAAERMHDHVSINAATAAKLAQACEAIARKNNAAVVIAIVDPQGLLVHVDRMDGEGLVSLRAAEDKALTALRTREPSHVLTNRNVADPFTAGRMAGYGLVTQQGGLPIIVNGQLIGAIGAGGITPVDQTPTFTEEKCIRDALEQVIGPQPPLLPDLLAARRNRAPAQ